MRRMGLLLCLSALVASTAGADETTYCNGYVTTLPYTINAQGHYCFDRNLSTNLATGAAITINADFVVLDLNNFKLGGGGAGRSTLAVGVRGINRSNIRVRNGNIRGFAVGIEIGSSSADATSSQNNVVEDNVLDGNTVMGISLYGRNNLVRNNRVSSTGQSTLAAAAHPCNSCTIAINGSYALDCSAGGDALNTDVVENIVAATGGPNSNYCHYDITATAPGSMVVKNVVHGFNLLNQPQISGDICRDNLVESPSGGTPYSCASIVGTTNYP